MLTSCLFWLFTQNHRTRAYLDAALAALASNTKLFQGPSMIQAFAESIKQTRPAGAEVLTLEGRPALMSILRIIRSKGKHQNSGMACCTVQCPPCCQLCCHGMLHVCCVSMS
jgi:hypothetical protein